jgi:rare lipoprotein A (peptidoglycan hydrolase)
MPRALAVLVVAALMAAPSAASAAGQSPDSAARAERGQLLVRIAELTDQLEDSQASVVMAQARQDAAQRILRQTRDRLRTRAVNAYLYGNTLPEAARRGPAIYMEVAIQKERDIVDAARQSREAADATAVVAEDARAALRTINAELAALRVDLDRRVAADDARRAEEDRKADEARRRANAQRAADEASARAAGEGSLLPRHKKATARQVELMATYPFGPLPTGTDIPAGLRDAGGRVSGKASWYGPGFHGRATASGAIYDQEGWTTASRDLPLGTMLIVSRGDKRVLLLVNDRGPYVYDRVLDLSHAAAVYLGVGVTPVEAMVVAPS